MAADAEKLCKRFDSLKSRRANVEAHCEEVAQYVLPNRMGFSGPVTMGEKRMQKVFDATGIHANELLGAGLHGLATNPASKWFSIRVPGVQFEDNDAIKDWAADVTDALLAEMYGPNSDLTTAFNELYAELGAFGTAVMFIGETDAGNLLFQARALSECFIAENHEGKVDTLFRKFTMTARQMEQRWGFDKLSAKTQKLLTSNKPDNVVDLLHCVYPRDDRVRGKKNKGNMPVASCYVERSEKHLLEESGFPEFPFAVPRWSKRPGEEYGTSPAMTALPDIKTLQEMDKTTLKAGQKAADPPLTIPDDGVVGPVRTVPGGFIYYRGDRVPAPLGAGGNLPITLEMMDERRNRIRTMFFADVLQFVSNADMTATEVVQRTTERMRLLGPIIGRLESELLGPLINRVYYILARAKKLPPPPPELAGKDFSIEYVSPIAMAQKQIEANAFTQTMGVLMPFAEATQSPAIFRRFKPDDVAKGVWEIFGGDPDWQKNDDELKAEAEAEAQAAQQAQTAAMAEQAASAMNQGAGAIDKMASAQQKGADLSQLMGG